jgi:uncharacterized protein
MPEQKNELTDSQEKQFSFGICKASEVNEDERTVTAVISTSSIDRDHEVLKASGIKLDSFIKNPVVPWSHNTFEPPIGKAIWIKKGTKRITAKVKFAMTERANEVWELFKGGFLKAFSVGFMPLKGHVPTTDEIKKNPDLAEARFIYDEWELLEFSPVTIPANAEALVMAIKQKTLVISDDLQRQLHVVISDDDDDDDAVMIPIKDIVPEIKVYIPVEPVVEVEVINAIYG